MQLIFWKPCKSLVLVAQNDLSILFQTRENVTKCHACHTKQGCATFETSKSCRFCSNPHRHSHGDLIADGCERLRTWKRPRTNTSQLPDSQSKTRTLRYVFGKKLLILFRFETRSRSMMQLKIDFSSNMVTIRDAQWSCSYVLSVPQEVMAEA